MSYGRTCITGTCFTVNMSYRSTYHKEGHGLQENMPFGRYYGRIFLMEVIYFLREHISYMWSCLTGENVLRVDMSW